MNKRYTFRVIIIFGLLILTTSCSGRKVGNATPSFRVQFDSQGGTAVERQVLNVGGKIAKPKDPTKVGYKFLGWYEDNQLVDFKKEIIADSVMKAKWKQVGEFEVVTIIFDSNGSRYIGNIDYKSGSIPIPPLEPELSTYLFLGWFCEDVLYDFTKPITKSTPVVAKWNKN